MRLIDADALEDKTDDRYSLGEIGRRERDNIVYALSYEPEIDAVPVLRCKNCEYWKHNSFVLEHDYCELTSTECNGSHFCSWGEKRNDETDH